MFTMLYHIKHALFITDVTFIFSVFPPSHFKIQRLCQFFWWVFFSIFFLSFSFFFISVIPTPTPVYIYYIFCCVNSLHFAFLYNLKLYGNNRYVSEIQILRVKRQSLEFVKIKYIHGIKFQRFLLEINHSPLTLICVL